MNARDMCIYKSSILDFDNTTWNALEKNIKARNKNTMLRAPGISLRKIYREKGRALTQPYDKSPYTHRKIKKTPNSLFLCHKTGSYIVDIYLPMQIREETRSLGAASVSFLTCIFVIMYIIHK